MVIVPKLPRISGATDWVVRLTGGGGSALFLGSAFFCKLWAFTPKRQKCVGFMIAAERVHTIEFHFDQL